MAPKIEGLSDENGEHHPHDGNHHGARSRGSKNTEEYRKRRERNNQAVKKSRMKTKLKTQLMVDRVTELRNENEELEESIKILTKELSILKDLFVAHAGNAHGVQLDEAKLAKMLGEDTEVDEGVALLMSLSQGPPP